MAILNATKGANCPKFDLFFNITAVQLSYIQKEMHIGFTSAFGCISDYNTVSASSLRNLHLYNLYKLKIATLLFVTV